MIDKNVLKLAMCLAFKERNKMESIVRTVYGSFLQTCMYLKLPFTRKASSTLNEKFGIQANQLPNLGEMPAVRYLAIGNGGHRMAAGADGTPKTVPVQHRATDASCYKPLPWVLREPTADLTVAERARYALRRIETHNSLPYVAYYLKRIDISAVTPQMNYVTVSAGTEVVTTFTPNQANLDPVPPELSANGTNVVTGDYTSAQAILTLSLTPQDVLEILNVTEVLYQDSGLAIISEIAMVSGLDKQVNSPGVGGATISFLEVICAQVVSHIAGYYPLVYASNGVDIELDAGATEPMFSLA